jgi:hypothetical protein
MDQCRACPRGWAPRCGWPLPVSTTPCTRLTLVGEPLRPHQAGSAPMVWRSHCSSSSPRASSLLRTQRAATFITFQFPVGSGRACSASVGGRRAAAGMLASSVTVSRQGSPDLDGLLDTDRPAASAAGCPGKASSRPATKVTWGRPSFSATWGPTWAVSPSMAWRPQNTTSASAQVLARHRPGCRTWPGCRWRRPCGR